MTSRSSLVEIGIAWYNQPNYNLNEKMKKFIPLNLQALELGKESLVEMVEWRSIHTQALFGRTVSFTVAVSIGGSGEIL